jgi:dipeptidyl aminopeptidase/acylaminoacyl peptidase
LRSRRSLEPKRSLLTASVLAVSCAMNAPFTKTVVEPRRPAVAVSERAPPSSMSNALPEDEKGVAGAPLDETAFDFEPDVGDDVSPLIDGAPLPGGRIVRSLEPYLEMRRARLASASANGDHLLVLTRLAETVQAHLVEQPLGMRRQVTFGHQPVQQASFMPGTTNRITYRVDGDGDENYQIVDLDLDSRARRLLTDGQSRHGPFRWGLEGKRIAYAGSARNGVDMDLYVLDTFGSDPPEPTLIREGVWLPLRWSKDGKRLLLREFRAKTESTVSVFDTESHRVIPLEESSDGTVHEAAIFAPTTPRVVYVIAMRGGDDVKALWRHDMNTGAWERLTNSPWDVEEMSLSSDGKVLAYTINEGGYSILGAFDVEKRKARIISGLSRGVITGLRFIGRKRRLAFDFSAETRPTDVFTLDVGTDQLTQWTRSETGGVPSAAFVAPDHVQYPSFDGLKIPALVYRPAAPGPHPVLVWIHGGPEEQTRAVFDPIIQYFAGRMRVAVVAPNLRGSDGYGRHFMSLDDGVRRQDAIKDVGALLNWINSEPSLDGKRVGIYGASYGGFVSMAALAAFGDRFKAGCDLVGISNLVTFLEETTAARRTLRRREYGDEREPDVRRALLAVSPLTNAARIQSPLLVAHGENDPRVPRAEAERIVEEVRRHGVDVWYMLARGEGHRLRKRRNRDTFYRLMVTFFAKYLLEPAEAPRGGSNGEASSAAAPDAGAPL